jgi:tRNA nucleotidyltransferase (CCA-adding enzyme)
MAGRAETFDHQADIGVAGEGPTLAAAFAAGAQAMFSIMCDVSRVAPRETVRITCSASDHELLFVRWLNTLLAEADVRGFVFREFELQIAEHRIEAVARGEPYDADRHGRGVEVKGATLTELEVVQRPAGWRAQTVVDV